jgi:hypothetical protein
MVLARYLAGVISPGRAAELIDLPWLDLRTHCLRLDVPLRIRPTDPDDARADVEASETWAAVSQRGLYDSRSRGQLCCWRRRGSATR